MSDAAASPQGEVAAGAGLTPRTGARVIVRDVSGRVLLFEGIDPDVPDVKFWFTAGGGLDAGETFEEAAARELREEAGLGVRNLGEAVREDEVEFRFEGLAYRQRQRYFAVEVPVSGDAVDIDVAGWTDDERRSMTGHRWWTLEEIEVTEDRIYPPGLADLVRSITAWGSAEPA